MIKAHVEMDLNDHISVIAAKIVEMIEGGDDLILETLMRKFLKKYNFYTPDQFLNGITFLFSIDCLTVKDYKVYIKNV
jgi:hypothetical protein